MSTIQMIIYIAAIIVFFSIIIYPAKAIYKKETESPDLPDCLHDRYCNMQTKYQKCTQKQGCNFKDK